MSENLKIAACYIRVSTDDQLEYSPDSQLSLIRKYAKDNGYVLPDEYIFVESEGISGRKANTRPSFQRMIATAKQKPVPFETLLLWKFSRFARNREDSIIYKSMLRKQGIDVISISEPIGDDKMSVILEAMIEAMDEYYSLNLSEEVRRGMLEAAKQGEWVSNPPFGYCIKHKKLVVIPEEAKIIQDVFQRYANGQSLHSLAVWLNDLGVKTHRNTAIQKRTVSRWLQNETYIGNVVWCPDNPRTDSQNFSPEYRFKGIHEPIVSIDLWEQVHKRLKETKSRYTRWDPSGSYVLSGIVRCRECGYTLQKSNKVFVKCAGYQKGICKHTQLSRISDVFDAIVLAIESDIGNLSFTTSETKIISNDDTKKIETLIKKEQAKLDRVKQAYISGIDTVEEYRTNKDKITSEINRLNSLLNKAKSSPCVDTSALKNKCVNLIKTLRSDAPDSEKNIALKSVIEKAVYSRDEIGYFCTMVHLTAKVANKKRATRPLFP